MRIKSTLKSNFPDVPSNRRPTIKCILPELFIRFGPLTQIKLRHEVLPPTGLFVAHEINPSVLHELGKHQGRHAKARSLAPNRRSSAGSKLTSGRIKLLNWECASLPCCAPRQSVEVIWLNGGHGGNPSVWKRCCSRVAAIRRHQSPDTESNWPQWPETVPRVFRVARVSGRHLLDVTLRSTSSVVSRHPTIPLSLHQ
jgi:hypothetical protein